MAQPPATHMEPRPQAQSCPLRRGDVHVRDLEGELLVHDSATGHTHRLNETAGFIWRHCDGAHDAAEIGEAMIDVYNITLDSAIAHAQRMIDELALRRLVVFRSENRKRE